MHFIHMSEGTEVKTLLPRSSRTLPFLDNICYLLYFRQHIRGFHNIILENPTYFFLSTTSAPAKPVKSRWSWFVLNAETITTWCRNQRDNHHLHNCCESLKHITTFIFLTVDLWILIITNCGNQKIWGERYQMENSKAVIVTWNMRENNHFHTTNATRLNNKHFHISIRSHNT